MKKHKKRIGAAGLLASLGLMIVLPGQTLLGEEPVAAENRFNKAFFTRFGKDFGMVLSSPKDWEKRDFLTLMTVSGAGLLLFAVDQDIRDWAQENPDSSVDDAFGLISRLGDGGYLLGFIAVLYAAGEFGEREGVRKTALLSLESLAITSFYVWGTKFILGRARPSTGESSHSFHPFSFSSAFWSLPSGHAASAFAVAATIADQTEAAAVDVLCYSLAALVGVSRIVQDKHWAADAFFGSALGYFVAKKVCALNRPSKRKNMNLSFEISSQRQALTLCLRF